MANRKRNIKNNNIFQLILSLAIIVLLNIIGSFVYTRFDLTSEKRYTLSESTKKLLKNLDDIVYFQVYLEGEFPAGFKRLRNATKEMLDEFRAYSNNIQYEFINPSSCSDKNERNDIYRLLIERGLNPTDLQVKTNDGTSQQIIFPGAIATYKSNELPVHLLISQMNMPPEEVLNNSIQGLEFNLANTIRKLTVNIKPKIAFIEGHGELTSLETADITNALKEYYIVDRIKIDGKLSSLTERDNIDSLKTRIVNKYKAIIIAKPDSVFNEKDKFIIDQFIMRGGKVLWLIDPVFASMDSLQYSEATMGIINNINLEDQLFNYGVRLNTNLIMDLNALPIPLRTGQIGGQPQIDFFPWYFFPVITPTIEHPVVNNLNAIKTEFISTIDTIKTSNVNKTILLTTSKYSRTVNTPVYINLDILKEEPDKLLYNKQNLPVACLLEGEFESVFKNRIPSEIMQNKDIGFLEKSIPNKMIIVADGDIIRNQIQNLDGKKTPLPLGYDRYTRQSFGNKEFILNAMNFLVDNSDLISIRSRELKLRLLDRTKINNNRLFWQLLNIILPVLMIIIFGIIQSNIRKRKFTKTYEKK
ncbi:MAG: gliding motility-associated ABC transporter substrate-binding protein GldG [Bacteroidales bacterium]|nr:gliding motility-associated ABC transporter substrate-binding protein GldG [Bacteroidales bacterium]